MREILRPLLVGCTPLTAAFTLLLAMPYSPFLKSL